QRHRPLLPDRPTTRRLTHRPVPVRPAARPDPRNPKGKLVQASGSGVRHRTHTRPPFRKPRQRPHEITHPRIQAKGSPWSLGLIAAHSPRVKPRVSGAHITATTAPAKVTTAPTTMVPPVPRCDSETGTRYVPMAAPIRLRDDASPTADPRISVGNNSFG